MSRHIAPDAIVRRLLLVSALMASVAGCVPYIVMNSMDHQHYSDYVVQTQKDNTTREENHLAPDPIMTFDQWKGTNSAMP